MARRKDRDGRPLSIVIRARVSASYDVQLHIGESISTGWGYGFRACAVPAHPGMTSYVVVKTSTHSPAAANFTHSNSGS